MADALLFVEGLCKSYPAPRGALDVLEGLSLSIADGEAVAVVGESGVGKSTLLHLLGGLDRPDAGTIRFRGRDVFEDETALIGYRQRDVGFVFQFHHLLPEFTAFENVLMPAWIRRECPDASRARSLLQALGLGERLGHHPAKLSGGEQQRVAIARALAGGASLVLADEPTGNLDPATGRQVFEEMRRLQAEAGCALVLVTHNQRLAAACDRVLLLRDGTLAALDSAAAEAYFGA